MRRHEPRNASPERRRASSEYAFRREGEYWTVVYRGDVVRVHDVKGMRYLAHLLGHPRQRVQASDLLRASEPLASSALRRPVVRRGEEPDGAVALERARLSVTKRIKAVLRRIDALHPLLGYHLATTVKTGRECVYTPPPGERVAWRQ